MIAKDASGESSSGYTITFNGNEPYTRQRFTIAQECAHFLEHRDRIGDGISDDVMYRSDKLNSQEEIEANNLAADLLMPKHLVVAHLRSGVSDAVELAKIFQMSAAAMRLRYLYSRLDYATA